MANSSMRVVSTGGALGADIWGIDVSAITDSDFDLVHQAWLEHDGVVRIPGQFVPERALIEFARRFGELDEAPVNASTGSQREDLPELIVISNIVENGKALGNLGAYESSWHTDMSYNDIPAKASALHAIELPREGGDTGYCNMYKAFDALPGELKERARTLTCKHDSSRNSVGEVREGFQEAYTDRNDAPGAIHPLVCRHPETDRECLYLGRRALAFIPELPDDESTSLLDDLWSYATQDHLTWYQKWRLGDLVVWDNRCTMHRRDALDPSERRLLNRAQIKGEVPTPARSAA